MATVTVHCPRCNSDKVYRHGHSTVSSARVFQLNYTCEARKPSVKEQIVEMAHNGTGVRDTSRTLKVGINTVIRTLKNAHHAK